jgi:hypothetical protein
LGNLLPGGSVTATAVVNGTLGANPQDQLLTVFVKVTPLPRFLQRADVVDGRSHPFSRENKAFFREINSRHIRWPPEFCSSFVPRCQNPLATSRNIWATSGNVKRLAEMKKP